MFNVDGGDQTLIHVYVYPEGFCEEMVEDALFRYIESDLYDDEDDFNEVIKTVLNSFDIQWHKVNTYNINI
jgi:hypothetical protein